MKMYVVLLAGLISASTAWGALGARARVLSKNGSDVRGTVEFKELENGDMKVTYNLKNLPKSQTLGMHIHERGDCTSRDAKSAGGHYAYMDSVSGTSTDFPAHYAGDLPSITSDGSGKAKGSFIVSDLSISRDNAINNRAIVIHGGPDDINMPSAPRIACGVIVGPQIAPMHSSARNSASDSNSPSAPY